MDQISRVPVGERFGRLTVLGFSHMHGHQAAYLVECECGERTRPLRVNLLTGNTLSCGCLRKERAGGIHGLSRLPEYQLYRDAKKRCRNPNRKDYSRYGGRGIEFRFKDFPEFYKALGPRPTPLHSVDRINNDGHYEPKNVRWATRQEQGKNRRKTNEKHKSRGIIAPLQLI